MTPSLQDQLAEDLACEDLLECVHGLGTLDRRCYRYLAERDGPATVDEIAEDVDRERSTVYRALQRLKAAGVARSEQVNYEHGGYYHVYAAVDADRVAEAMQRTLNDWYATVGSLIGEFRETYEGDEADGRRMATEQ